MEPIINTKFKKMNPEIPPARRRYDCSRHYQLVYSLYTFIKLSIIIALIISVPRCSSVLNVYLILYCATEGYELLFMILLIAHRYCFLMAGSSFLISIGQASYECFRFIITIAMTVELCKHSACIVAPQGIVGMTLVVLGYLKYAIVIIIIVCYCAYFRSINRNLLSEDDLQAQNQENEQFLIARITQVPLSEPCSICMEDNPDEAVVGLDCGHNFHMKCLKDWVRIKGSCPMCRRHVRQ